MRMASRLHILSHALFSEKCPEFSGCTMKGTAFQFFCLSFHEKYSRLMTSLKTAPQKKQASEDDSDFNIL
jgi:hypothetical protein